MNKRIFYYDEIRCFAILFVILAHVTNIYLPFNYSNLHNSIPGFINVIGFMGVPLFFMLSGALLLNRDYPSLSSFYKKRFSRIIYPFIFWMIITGILVYLFLNPNDIVSIVLGKDNYTWFFWAIAAIYLVLPIFNSFLKEYGDSGMKLILVLWIISTILYTFKYDPFKYFDLSYVSGFIGYFILGYYLSHTDFKINNIGMVLIGFIMMFAGNLAHMFIKYNDLNIITSYKSLFVVIAATGFFLIFKGINDYCKTNFNSKLTSIHEKIENGKLGKLIFLISTCSYGMYFANSLIVRFLRTLDITSFKLIPIIYIFVVILSLLLVLIFSKIKFLNKFSGAS
ncbi:MAG: acyltransferase [Methanobrevibacter sp.]|nr:acyltransferase [Methanobrevibacter sp.]MBE6490800.1 acyltransferase [Methanobrevibacter sp.]